MRHRRPFIVISEQSWGPAAWQRAPRGIPQLLVELGLPDLEILARLLLCLRQIFNGAARA